MFKISIIMKFTHKSVFLVEIILICLPSLALAVKDYTNYTLVKTIPVSYEHIEYLKSLPKSYDLNFWWEPVTPNFPVEFSVSLADLTLLYPTLSEMGLTIETMNTNIQSIFDEETVGRYISRRTSSFNWLGYYQIQDIYDWLRDLETNNKDKMTVMSIGTTYEHRDILAVKIKFPGKKNKTIVMIEGGIHARERVAVAYVTFLINEIINSQSHNGTEFKRIAAMCEWYIIPCLNPDGYQYTFTGDRLWRKNRRRFGSDYGVDLNRNFDVDFYSTSPEGTKIEKEESEIYHGPTPFSEAESRSIKDFTYKLNKKISYYIAFHSFGQYIIIPYAASKLHLENYNEVQKLCLSMANVIKSFYETEYDCGTAFDTVGYLCSGTSTDWMKRTFKVPYTMSIELRNKYKLGFSLPAEYIIPTSIEMMNGLLYLINSTTSEDYKKRIEFSSGHCIYANWLVFGVIATSFLSVILT